MSLYLWWRDNPAYSVRAYSVKRYQRNLTQYFEKLSDTDCIDLYRLDKAGINYFTQRIEDHHLIRRKTKAGLPAKIQLLVALRYFSTGNSLRSLQRTADLNLSHGAVENCIKNVSIALSSLSKSDVCYSWDALSTSIIKQGFAEYGMFPGVLGAIDGTKIKIKSPPIDEDSYVGRHPGHYINCQVICDSKLKFLDAVARWPGSVNDSVIWDNCAFNKKLDSFLKSMPTQYKGWLIGDSGYSQREEMMIPFLECTNSAEEVFNKCHKRSRSVVERAIGVLKSRFRCLCKQSGGAIRFDETTACLIFISCVVLHNYCIDRNFPSPIAPDVQQRLDEERYWQEKTANTRVTQSESQRIARGFEARHALVEEHFKNLKVKFK